MRLINTRTLEMEEFLGDRVPRYVILSHTWGDEEVTFDDWQQPETSGAKMGWAKITGACEAAARLDCIDYIWIDTACIDKRSSAELSEAINSMFSWYRDAELCLVHLADFDIPSAYSPPAEIPDSAVTDGAQAICTPPDDLRQLLAACRWFTRGWTLQELLAPRHVGFLSRDWRLIGNLQGLVGAISTITRIPHKILSKDEPLHSVSIAQRMSWAAVRDTTRIEDQAYCLLGIFDINMPLLYGEGSKAFVRLQTEIIRGSADQSILAWRRPADLQVGGSGRSRFPIFAPSPRCFLCEEDIVQIPQSYSDDLEVHYTLTNSGLLIRMPILRTLEPKLALGILDCYAEHYDRRMCLVLYTDAGGSYVRLSCVPVTISHWSIKTDRPKLYITSSSPTLEYVLGLRVNDASTWLSWRRSKEEGPWPLFIVWTTGVHRANCHSNNVTLGVARLEEIQPGVRVMTLKFQHSDTETHRWVGLVCRSSKENLDEEPSWLRVICRNEPLSLEDVLEQAHDDQNPPMEVWANYPDWGPDLNWVPNGCPLLFLQLPRSLLE
ncbi:hypothetical protein ACJ41O_002239 [Fusarium nematophilum]